MNKLRPSANHILTDGQSVSWSWRGTATGLKWACIIYNDSLQYSQRIQCTSISKANNVSVLLYRKIVAVFQNIKQVHCMGKTQVVSFKTDYMCRLKTKRVLEVDLLWTFIKKNFVFFPSKHECMFELNWKNLIPSHFFSFRTRLW